MRDFFLHGFAGELLKIAAGVQIPQDDGVLNVDAGIDDALNKSIGQQAKSGIKSPAPVPTSLASRPPSPYPKTSPTKMVG